MLSYMNWLKWFKLFRNLDDTTIDELNWINQMEHKMYRKQQTYSDVVYFIPDFGFPVNERRYYNSGFEVYASNGLKLLCIELDTSRRHPCNN